MIWTGLLILIGLIVSKTSAYPVQQNLLSDVTSCLTQWMMETPLDIRNTSDLVYKLSDNPHYGLRYMLLFEPYITYLLTVEDELAGASRYMKAFANYCDKWNGVEIFISCMKKSESLSSQRNEMNGQSPASVNILDNLFGRYCADAGGVKVEVVEALVKGSRSEEIMRLVDYVTASRTNGSVICSDVVESSMQTAAQLLSNDHIRVDAFFNIMKSGIEMFTRCLMVTVSPNQKSPILKQHLEMVLLELIDSNMADITRVEMSTARQMISLAGYSNVLIQGRQFRGCAITGTQRLLENSHLMLTGTLLYERIPGVQLPYLAAVHMQFPVYDERTLQQIGHATYNSGVSDELETELTMLWWGNPKELLGRVSSYDHGISVKSIGTKNCVELVDLRTGTYISLCRSGNMLTLVIRMYTTFLYQSSGLLLEPCNTNGLTPVYSVLQTSSACREICHQMEVTDIRSMCQKDCLLSNKTILLSEVYNQLEEMFAVAVLQDDLIEEMSAAENEPEVTVPGDDPLLLPSTDTSYYSDSTTVLKSSVKYDEWTVTAPLPELPLYTTPQTKATSSTPGTKRLPSGLRTPPAPHGSASRLSFDWLFTCICILIYHNHYIYL